MLLADFVSNIQIVKEYERAVIFRLGRITDRKPKGPGFHIMTYELTIIRKEIHILYSLVVSIRKLLFLAFQDFSLFCLALILL